MPWPPLPPVLYLLPIFRVKPHSLFINQSLSFFSSQYLPFLLCLRLSPFSKFQASIYIPNESPVVFWVPLIPLSRCLVNTSKRAKYIPPFPDSLSSSSRLTLHHFSDGLYSLYLCPEITLWHHLSFHGACLLHQSPYPISWRHDDK